MITKEVKVVEQKKMTFIHVKRAGIHATFLDYGATVYKLEVPDKNGVFENVLMEYDEYGDYLKGKAYLNAIVGPSSGRVRDGVITVNEERIELDRNFMGNNHLHGGKEAFSHQFFKVETVETTNASYVHMHISSKGDVSLYPGDKYITVTYEVTDQALRIIYQATSSKETFLNMTFHGYFNLSGNMKRTVEDHLLQINASKVMIPNEFFVATDIKQVDGSHLDFRSLLPVRAHLYEGIHETPLQGVDHPFLLDKDQENAATLIDPESGRKMTVETSYPALVCYTHNLLDDIKLAHNTKTRRHLGVCLEAQYPPNSQDFPELIDPILKKNELYFQTVKYSFDILKKSLTKRFIY